MTRNMVSTTLVVAGCIGSSLAFLTLVAGLYAIGGGHGSPALWILGLISAAVSGILMVAGSIFSAARPVQRGTLALGLLASAGFALLWLNFFAVVQWLF